MNFKKFLRNKKGEKVFSIWWFVVLIFVGVGIIGGVLVFYSANVDVRGEEAKILYDVLNECMIRQGVLSDKVLSNDFDVYADCGLKKELFEEKDNYYFAIDFFDKDGKILRDVVKSGGVNFEVECGFQSNEDARKAKADNFPKCFEDKTIFTYYEKGEGKKGNLEIITASNQNGRKVFYEG